MAVDRIPGLPQPSVLGNLVTRLNDPGSLGKNGARIPRNGTVGVHGRGPVQSVLTFQGCRNDPQVLTASLFAILNLRESLEITEGIRTQSGFTGPLVGIALWGSGNSAQHKAEFDIPVGLNVSDLLPGQMGENYGAGQIISVPASWLEIGVRNDAALTPRVDDNPLGFVDSTDVFFNAPEVSGNVAVHARAPGTSLSRTIWAVNGSYGGDGGGLAPTETVSIVIPPYAQSFVVLRSPGFEIQVSQMNQFAASATSLVDGPYIVPASTPCPEMILNNSTCFINVTNNNATTLINRIAVVYGLSL